MNKSESIKIIKKAWKQAWIYLNEIGINNFKNSSYLIDGNKLHCHSIDMVENPFYIVADLYHNNGNNFDQHHKLFRVLIPHSSVAWIEVHNRVQEAQNLEFGFHSDKKTKDNSEKIQEKNHSE
jgi:hypothetical protein